MRTKTLAILFSLVAALAAPASAIAATATATGTVSGSSLSVSTTAAPSFSANLDNGDSTPTFTVPLTTQDTRGTGAGWNETITSTQYSTGGAAPNTLATNASSLTGVTSSCAQGSCTSPTNSVTYPLTVPAGSTPPYAVKFYNAAANTGMGKFTVTPSVNVTIPANTFAGSYSSTVTLAVVSGP
jgi:hypothetical protein